MSKRGPKSRKQESRENKKKRKEEGCKEIKHGKTLAEKEKGGE